MSSKITEAPGGVRGSAIGRLLLLVFSSIEQGPGVTGIVRLGGLPFPARRRYFHADAADRASHRAPRLATAAECSGRWAG